MLEQVEGLALGQAVATAMGEVNGYLERTAPWREAKAGHGERVATILYTACETLRLVAVLLQPVLPERRQFAEQTAEQNAKHSAAVAAAGVVAARAPRGRTGLGVASEFYLGAASHLSLDSVLK